MIGTYVSAIEHGAWLVVIEDEPQDDHSRRAESMRGSGSQREGWSIFNHAVGLGTGATFRRVGTKMPEGLICFHRIGGVEDGAGVTPSRGEYG